MKVVLISLLLALMVATMVQAHYTECTLYSKEHDCLSSLMHFQVTRPGPQGECKITNKVDFASCYIVMHSDACQEGHVHVRYEGHRPGNYKCVVFSFN